MSGNRVTTARSWTVDEFAEAVDGMAPVAVRAVATLRLADHIAGGFTELPRLADRVGVDESVLGRLMRYLSCRGVFREFPAGVYALTEYSVALLEGHPSQLRAWLDVDGVGQRLDRAVGRLLDGVRTGQPTYPDLFGTDFYDDMSRFDGTRPGFHELRAAHAASFVPQIGSELDWTGVASVVDVGGGTGLLLEELLCRHQSMRGFLVDMPAAVSAAITRFAAAGLADRFVPAAGSFFDPLPIGADAYIMVNVLHNWDDDPATAILAGCRRAGHAGSRIITVEKLHDDTDPRTTTAMDLRMFLFCGGRERSLTHLERLGSRAGLTLVEQRPVTADLHMLWFEVSP